MSDLLLALGWKVGRQGEARVIAMMGAAALTFVFAGIGLARLLGIPMVILQAAIWAGWLAWLGVAFPHRNQSDASSPCDLPYLRAFTREILAGIGVAFSQILRPAMWGLLTGSIGSREASPATIAIGALIALTGLGMIGLGVTTLGVARTLFVSEYVPTDRKVMVKGIYRVLRHPLFLGGVAVSLGLAICTGDLTAVELALVNLAAIPFYARLEDKRCCTILGQAYADYRNAVGGIVPRAWTAMRDSPLAHQLLGRRGPIIGRNQVRKP